MNAKLIEGLKAVRDGIDLILASENVEVSTPAETPVTKGKTATPVETKEAPVVETTAPAVGDATREQLDSMTYNNLKKFAKDREFPQSEIVMTSLLVCSVKLMRPLKRTKLLLKRRSQRNSARKLLLKSKSLKRRPTPFMLKSLKPLRT